MLRRLAGSKGLLTTNCFSMAGPLTVSFQPMMRPSLPVETKCFLSGENLMEMMQVAWPGNDSWELESLGSFLISSAMGRTEMRLLSALTTSAGNQAELTQRQHTNPPRCRGC